MTAEPSPGRITAAEFLTWASAQPKGRYELVRVEPVRLPPETAGHRLTKGGVSRALGDAVKRAGLPYYVFGSGAAVVVDDEHVRNPDGSVQSKASTDLDAVTLDEPLIVVEVLWPSHRSETEDKLVEYFSVPSIRHYLVVHPMRKIVIHHGGGQDGRIVTYILNDSEIDLTPPGITMQVADLLPEFR
jgi:Uma2 family endonuclease